MLRKKKLLKLASFLVFSVAVTASSVALASRDHTSREALETSVSQVESYALKRPDWSQDMLDVHNQWRRKVGVPALTWSDDLAQHAQEWANQLANENFKLYHRPNNPFGENLTWAAHQQLTPLQVVNSWGEEVAQYDYDSNSCSGVCGHYTQIVWQETTEVGCAVVRSQQQEIWVCNYNPPGNYVGVKPY